MSLNGGSGVYTANGASITASLMNAVATPKWFGQDMTGCVGECNDEIGFWYP